MFHELPMCISNFLKLYFIFWLVIKTVQKKPSLAMT